jgi:colicin import membrane protein
MLKETTMEGTLWSLYQRQTPRFQLTRGMIASVVIHVLVAATALTASSLQPRRSLPMPFYSVDLVSLDQAGLKDGGGMGGAGKKTAAPGPALSKAHQAIPVVPVERLRAQSLSEPVTPLKKLDTKADINPVSKSSSPALDKTLDKLIPKPKQAAEAPSAKAGSEDPKPAGTAGQAEPESGAKAAKGTESKGPAGGAGQDGGTSQGAGSSTGQGGSGSAAAGGGDPGAIGLARRLYYTEVWNAIRREWALDTSRLKGQHLVATIVLVVRRDGKIMHYRFERKSGNSLLDESAERAVRKVDTLPPFPKIYSPNQEEIGINFRPEDLG